MVLWFIRKVSIPKEWRPPAISAVTWGNPPLATSHLTDYDGKTVIFWYKDTQTGEKIVVRYSALDFISSMVPHIPPKGLQMVRYAGLYARCVKRRWREIANAALEAIRTQFPLFALDPLG